MAILFWICAGLTAVGLTLYALQVIAVRRSLATRSVADSPCTAAFLPPISVLKPLKGLDDNLFDNLDSFCRQSYPVYEIIFSLQDHNDPAYKIARKIRDKHADRDIRIIIESCNRGMNPKVNNLIPAYRESRYNTILISDSNVLVGPDYLRSIGRHLSDPSVGLVTNLIRGTNGRTFGSLFENLHLNSFIVGSVCFLDRFLGMPCVIGKSMLMRKKDLDAIGGFDAVKDVLAEDFIIGRRMHDSGRRIVVDNYLINNENQYWGVRRFLNRHTRWAKLRWKIGGPRYLTELLANPVFLAFLPLTWSGFTGPAMTLALCAAMLKIAGDRHLGIQTGASTHPFAYLLVPVKDLIIGVLWFVPLLSDTVLWRGNRYRIVQDSRLLPVPESGIWSWRYRLASSIRERFA
jgi:ceramide glucosyltransferase